VSGLAQRSLRSWEAGWSAVTAVASLSAVAEVSAPAAGSACSCWSCWSAWSWRALWALWALRATRPLGSGEVALALGCDVRLARGLGCRCGRQALRTLRFQAPRAAAEGALARSLSASALRSLRAHWSARALGPLGILPQLAGQRGANPAERGCLIAMHRRCLGDARRRHEHGGSSDEDCTAGQIGHNIRFLALSYRRVTRFAPLAHSLQPPGDSDSATDSKTVLPLGHGERSSLAGHTSLFVIGKLQ
jgi:hypothetical protein